MPNDLLTETEPKSIRNITHTEILIHLLDKYQ